MTTHAGVTLVDPNQQSKTVSMNQAITDTIDKGSKRLAVAMTDADKTLTDAEALLNAFFDLSGTLTAGRNLIVPDDDKFYVVSNGTTGGFSVTVKTSAGTGIAVGSGATQVLYCDGTNVIQITESASNPTESLIVACGDETTAISAGTGKVTFRMPYAFTLTGVRASLVTAQASGANIFTVDINEDGTSILSTKITIDNTEKTSTTAATAAVISDTSLADDAEITVDVDQIGDGTAAGLKITLIGRRA